MILLQFWTIVYPYKLCVTEKRTCVKKFKSTHIITVLLSIPLNYLPWTIPMNFPIILCGGTKTCMEFIWCTTLLYFCPIRNFELTTGFWGKEAWRLTPKWNTRFSFAFSKRTNFFSLPSQRNFPITFKPKVAIAKFVWKMQKKNLAHIIKGGLAAMPLFLLDDPLNVVTFRQNWT